MHPSSARRVEPGMRTFPAIAVSAAVLAVTACGSSASSAGNPSASVPATTPASPAPAATLGPLTLGHFPATADGRLARGICEGWAALRQEYAQRLSADTPYQLEQWLSGPAWSVVDADGTKLGADPAFASLGTALGLAEGSAGASMSSALLLDKACEKAG